MIEETQQVKIENTPMDPFWAIHSSLPFTNRFSRDDLEDVDGVSVFRNGTEIGVEAGERTIYLDLMQAAEVWSALRDAVDELRKVCIEQQRYLSERSSLVIDKQIEALPDALRKAGKDAAGIARILEKVSADPVKESFWVGNAAILLDQLRESLHVITLTVAAAKAQSECEKEKR